MDKETKKASSVIRPTDDEALRLARRLARGSRFGALAVLEPGTGHPFSSRVLIGTDADGVPVMLSSALSTHTRAVLADPRCSLLVGEPGRGDPLAWPRLTILAEAERVKPDTESHSRIRSRFLRRHPKAGLYVDFGDFSFFRLVPKSASLNGGFGKSYFILGTDLVMKSATVNVIANQELHLLEQLNALSKGVPDLLVKYFFKEKTANWTIVGLDAEGLDLARKEQLLRYETLEPASSINGLIAVYSDILKCLLQN
jgi:putative heme iron utilization protein